MPSTAPYLPFTFDNNICWESRFSFLVSLSFNSFVSATLCQTGSITAELIQPWLQPVVPPAEGAGVLRDGRMLEDMEKQLIERTLARFGGHRAKSAKALGMGVRTLGMKIKQWREQQERDTTLLAGVGVQS